MFEEKGKHSFFKTFLTALATSLGVGALLLFMVSGYISGEQPNTQVPSAERRTDEPQPQQIAAETNISPIHSAADVARTATPGVVGISVLKVDSRSLFDSETSESWGVGSGVIVSPDGYILTNHHVAGGKNKRIVVSLFDGSNLEGMTVWSDSVLDLAVVKVNASNLDTIPTGDANSLQVGEPAIAIGNPLGLQFQRTVTSGIISALNRTIRIDTEQGSNYMEDLIQTDASINPGNSGGPLLNARGNVIGINTVKVTSAEGIGFAVPINVAVPIIKRLTEEGKFDEPYLGIFAYDKEVIPYLNNAISLDNGIYVANVDKSGPAYAGGIRVGCIISEVDGNEINTMIQLRTYLYSKRPGDSINVTHMMEGTQEFVTTPIKLAQKDGEQRVTR
ncbi:S1-C subfamily serine protease [Anaerobacterium chartisolvens]|uniref:S1-C subfamily serine protease n=1 Tax=Anaerobacterium chartisolvens TaxID=1297424 RepID=A0A369AV52_9FIRM|nr:trypsin-like peptidase domain-containing protein [Anaerobacterium chartisolvens]RCX13199.1 S1-C subfamily serine protease [Anaerobacterium chartisolvens]